MQWWNDFVAWLASEEGWRVISVAVIPPLAILVAGVIAALIARGTVKRLLDHRDRAERAAAVGTLLAAGRKAAIWNSLTDAEQTRAEAMAGEADVRIRVLPFTGAALAARWAEHQLVQMKKASSNYTFRADQTLDEFRERLLAWQRNPKRAKRLFGADLERWRFEEPESVDIFAETETDESDAAARWAPIHSRAMQMSEERTADARPPAGQSSAGQSPAAQSPAAQSSRAEPSVESSDPMSDEAASFGLLRSPDDAPAFERRGDSAPSAGEADDFGDDDFGPVGESDRVDERDDPRMPPPVTASVVRQRIAPRPDDDTSA